MPDLQYTDYWFNYVLNEDPTKIKEMIREDEIISDGLKIHLNIFDEDDPLKNTILFIHGTSVYSRFYAEACYRLFKEGYRVIAPDLIGHGISEGIRGHFTMERYMKTLSDVTDYIIEKYEGKIIAIGSSLGGISALYYAAYDDDRIEGSVCHNAALFSEKAYKKLIKRKLVLMIRPIVPFIAKIAPKLKLPVSLYLDFKKLAKTDKVLHMVDMLLEDDILSDKYTATAIKAHLKAKLAKPIESIETPIMIINGDQDVLFSVEYMTEIFDRLTCKNKKLEILENTSHLIFQENLDETLDIIIPWLKEII